MVAEIVLAEVTKSDACHGNYSCCCWHFHHAHRHQRKHPPSARPLNNVECCSNDSDSDTRKRDITMHSHPQHSQPKSSLSSPTSSSSLRCRKGAVAVVASLIALTRIIRSSRIDHHPCADPHPHPPHRRRHHHCCGCQLSQLVVTGVKNALKRSGC